MEERERPRRRDGKRLNEGEGMSEKKRRFGMVDVVALVLALVTFGVIIGVLIQNFYLVD